jgi:hypothetical protein
MPVGIVPSSKYVRRASSILSARVVKKGELGKRIMDFPWLTLQSPAGAGPPASVGCYIAKMVME